MRAPEFWWQPKPNLAAQLLAPLGSLYGAITARRMARHGLPSALPVICVGNFVAGGAGKTPAAITIAQHLLAKGERPVFLSRGYRGHLTALPCQVDLAQHSATDVGDEALLLARVAPTVIGADRVASVKRAEVIGASLVILDDGLQNPSLAQDVRLAIVDGKTGIGNGLCIPAGPLRAPMSGQLACVSALVFIGERQTDLREMARASGKPVLSAKLIPEKAMSERFAGQKLVAFAGIGLPEKFRATLEDLGADVVGWRSFPDHHAYSLSALRHLQIEAAQNKALLITTEKDFVRFTPLIGRLDKTLPLPIPLPIKLVFDDDSAIETLLRDALCLARSRATL